jgi:hypothetical protein
MLWFKLQDYSRSLYILLVSDIGFYKPFSQILRKHSLISSIYAFLYSLLQSLFTRKKFQFSISKPYTFAKGKLFFKSNLLFNQLTYRGTHQSSFYFLVNLTLLCQTRPHKNYCTDQNKPSCSLSIFFHICAP